MRKKINKPSHLKQNVLKCSNALIFFPSNKSKPLDCQRHLSMFYFFRNVFLCCIFYAVNCCNGEFFSLIFSS